MNNRIKLDTTMLQSNSAMHLMAFMLTQRDLLLEILEIVKSYDEMLVLKQSLKLSNTLITKDDINWCIVKELEDIDTFDDPALKRRIREVAEDFEYITKKHTTAIHRRSGTKIYKKDKCHVCDSELDTWSTDGAQKRKDII